MKTTHPFTLLVLVVLLAGCTTVYRTGQTPDDVYYSPARPEDEYLAMQRQETRRYRTVEEDYEDRYLRMRVRDRNRWDELNTWYAYERWTLGFNSYFTPAFNPFVSWNHYYNPYYLNTPYYFLGLGQPTIVKQTYTKPRTFNLGSYQQLPVNLKTVRAQTGAYAVSPLVNVNAGKISNIPNRGNALREAFGVSTPSSNSSSSSSSSSNSASSSQGSSAPVRRF
jgi:hypothetical protein